MGTVGSGPFVPIVDFANLSFLEASPAAGTVVPQTFNLGVAPAGTVDVMAEFHLTMAPGDKTFAVTAGVPQPTAGQQPLVLVRVDTARQPFAATTIPNAR
jgi:hypothetical protein